MKDAFTIWFTGVTGSGKSSIGTAVGHALGDRGLTVELLDSGRIRQLTNRSVGFTREEIEANVQRLAYECGMLNRNGVVAIVMAVSPYRDVRDRAREAIGNFVEVHCRAPMEVLVKRDKNDLIERATKGEVEHVAGINAPYEEPLKPEVLLNTDQHSVEECVRKVVTTLELLGKIDRSTSPTYTPDEEQMIRQRLQDLGYL
jgi:adenylylsulfate kinase